MKYFSLGKYSRPTRSRSLPLVAAGLLALVLGGCTTGPSAPEATVFELGQMNRDFAAAINAGDAKKAAALYTEEATMLPPGERIVRGRGTIETYWKAGIEAGVKDVSVDTIAAHSSGTMGYEIGTYRMMARNPQGEWVADHGKFIEILQRQPDGRWMSVSGIWNSTPD